MDKSKSVKIEFSIESLVTITLFALSLYFLWATKKVWIILFIAFIMMSSLSPMVKWLEKKKVPKTLAIGLIYILGFTGLVSLLLVIVVPLVSQMAVLFDQLPSFINAAVNQFDPLRDWYLASDFDKQLLNVSGELAKQAVGLSGNFFQIFKQAWGVIGTLFGLFSVIILSLYMLVEHDHAISALLNMVPVKDRVRALTIVNKVEEQLGRWLRGQFLLSIIVGTLVWIVLVLLRVEFALPLAMLACLFEIVPNLGPLISLIPAWIIALSTGGIVQIIGVPIAYWLIQQVENHYIVPQVMKKAVGLNPVITMVAFLIGVEIGGVPGALLAVPIAAVVQILIQELRK